MFAHDVFTPRHYVMAICLTLSYFMARHYNIMTSSQVEAIQGNTHIGPIPIESYFVQIKNLLNSTLNEISALRQSHSALEARVISMQLNTNKPDERQGEPSFVIKLFTGEKKERTKEAICTLS